MISYSGQNDIVRPQVFAQRDGINFRLAYTGDDFTVPWRSAFERSYICALLECKRTRMFEGRAGERSHPALATTAFR